MVFLLLKTSYKVTMFSYYKNIDENDIREIQNNEEKICNKFKEEFEGRYIHILRRYGIHSEISIERCIDDIGLPWKKNDGYAAILQVDFLDSNNSVIEIDENVFSFYEDITVVSYILFKRKYRVYQADKLEELWTDIENAIKLLNDFGIG